MSPLASTPPPTTAPAPALVRPAAATPSGWTSYTVRAGDTLSDIAKRVGTTPGVIAAHNHLPNDGRVIQIGAVLLVPGTSAGASGTPTAGRVRASGAAAPARAKAGAVATVGYRVARGDTLEAIARRSGATQVSIIKANTLTPPYRIHPGQVLQIPTVAATTAPASTPANTFAGRTYPQAVVDAATANRDALRGRRVPSRTAMRGIIATTAQRNGVDPRLALAVAHLESGWDMRQVSVANAIGAMQVIPSTVEWASTLAGRRLDPLDAQDNALAGVLLLRALGRSAASLDEVIAGYYQGLGSVQANGMYADTRQYVSTVKALMGRV